VSVTREDTPMRQEDSRGFRGAEAEGGEEVNPRDDGRVMRCVTRAPSGGCEAHAVGRRPYVTTYNVVNVVAVLTRVKFRRFHAPQSFFGQKAIARRSSSAARSMRTAAARRGPMDPQLVSCKREATEQTV